MILSDPQKYDLKIANNYSYTLFQNNEQCTFSAPATVRGIAKLYTVTQDNVLFYVGIAKQPMASRLNYGFQANGQNGYHGYKWKDIRSVLQLTVWTAKNNEDYVTLNDMETIEAEVAYLCRYKSKQWPKYQHEIHFYQSKEIHRDLASTIYNAISN